ncbi:hypothetical protein EVAR_36013_1 [Eumeta japonica]|uniref:Uncharacterized protein n=1 Tax=Eumeta variegata TaxID=151549 RepID=A0A4C1WWL0_EUMVA|nr:hypothetical protein EVAR_36013_1 [Eumeta japonica]
MDIFKLETPNAPYHLYLMDSSRSVGQKVPYYTAMRREAYLPKPTLKNFASKIKKELYKLLRDMEHEVFLDMAAEGEKLKSRIKSPRGEEGRFFHSKHRSLIQHSKQAIILALR